MSEITIMNNNTLEQIKKTSLLLSALGIITATTCGINIHEKRDRLNNLLEENQLISLSIKDTEAFEMATSKLSENYTTSYTLGDISKEEYQDRLETIDVIHNLVGIDEKLEYKEKCESDIQKTNGNIDGSVAGLCIGISSIVLGCTGSAEYCKEKKLQEKDL